MVSSVSSTIFLPLRHPKQHLLRRRRASLSSAEPGPWLGGCTSEKSSVYFSTANCEKLTKGFSSFSPWYMGMGQNLLVSILMGWTSIYQLFCGSLGTRVMTHSHINIHEHCNFHPFSMAMLDYQRVDQNRSEWTLLVNECQWTMMKPCNSIVSAFQSPLRP